MHRPGHYRRWSFWWWVFENKTPQWTPDLEAKMMIGRILDFVLAVAFVVWLIWYYLF